MQYKPLSAGQITADTPRQAKRAGDRCQHGIKGILHISIQTLGRRRTLLSSYFFLSMNGHTNSLWQVVSKFLCVLMGSCMVSCWHHHWKCFSLISYCCEQPAAAESPNPQIIPIPRDRRPFHLKPLLLDYQSFVCVSVHMNTWRNESREQVVGERETETNGGDKREVFFFC